MKNLVIVDLGSNSVRMAIIEISANGHHREFIEQNGIVNFSRNGNWQKDPQGCHGTHNCCYEVV